MAEDIDIEVCVLKAKALFPSLLKGDLRQMAKAQVEFRPSRADNLRKKNMLEKTQGQIEDALLERAHALNTKVNNNIRMDEAMAKGVRGLDLINMFISGSSKALKGGNFSYDSLLSFNKGKLINSFNEAIKPFRPIIRDGSMDGKIVQHIIDVSKGLRGSTNEVVAGAAEAIKKNLDNSMKMLKEGGIHLKDRADYFGRQTHSVDKIGAVTAKDWAKEIQPYLDPISFEGIKSKDIGKYLEGVHARIIKSGELGNTKSFTLGGKRSFHFKDGASWASYNSKFGEGTLLNGIDRGIGITAKNAALGQMFGRNARDAYDQLVKRVGTEILEGNSKIAPGFYNNSKMYIMGKLSNKSLEQLQYNDFASRSLFFTEGSLLKGLEAEVFGYAYDPAGDWVAAFVRTMGLVQAGSKLTFSLIRTASDTATTAKAFNTSFNERSGITTFKAVRGFLSLISKKERVKFANYTMMHLDDMKVAQLNELGIGEGGFKSKVGNFVNNTYEKFVDFSGLPLQSQMAKLTNYKMIGAELDFAKNTSFNDLGNSTRVTFDRMGITEADWDIIRQGSVKIGGNDFIMPLQVEKLEGGFGPSKKLSMLMHDVGKAGVTETTMFEKALINRGTGATSVVGAMLRLAGQFKSFPLALPRVINRIGNNAHATKGNIGYVTAVSSTIASIAFYEYLSQESRNFLKGKDDAFTLTGDKVMKALLSTSHLQVQMAFDISMRSIRNEDREPMLNAMRSVLGPTTGEALFLSNNLLKHVGDKNAGGKMINDIFDAFRRNAPFSNFLWENAITEDAIRENTVYQIKEMFDPGFMKRRSKNKKRREREERRKK